MNLISFVLLGFFLSVSALTAGTYINKAETGEKSEIVYPPLSEENKEKTTVQDKIKEYFEGVTTNNEKPRIRNKLHRFYYDRKYMPVWVRDGHWLKSIDYARKTVDRSDQEGLVPSDYKAIHVLSDKTYKTEAELAKAEIEITQTVVKYIKDLKHGRISQAKIKNVLADAQKEIDPFQILNEGFESDSTGAFLTILTVDAPEYQALKKLLARYMKMKKDGVRWVKVSEDVTLKRKDPANNPKAVKLLRAALSSQGYLNEGAEEKKSSEIYDEKLENAVKTFQREHIIESDGIVGSQTRKALNTSLQDRIYQILTVMERWRWMPEDLGKKYVLVNIPMFELIAYEDKATPLEMSIIVGKQYRKTPTFSSKIKLVRFNPSWHVPPGIFMKDKLPKILNDPGYVSRMGYVAYDSDGHRVDPAGVDWESGDYRLVQPPSNKNALGKIRFTLNTTNDVYLHGTPQQELFSKQIRTFSSGCIRVEHPDKLAFWLFDDPQKWSMERIKKESSGSVTNNVPLPHPVNVYIVYFTVQANPDGKAYFANDIYHQDDVITNEIKKMYHDPSVLSDEEINTLHAQEDILIEQEQDAENSRG